MKTKSFQLITLVLFLFFQEKIAAQIGINATNTPPATNAMLDISSTTKGLLIPRMTTAQRNTLAASEGLTVYDTDTKGYWFHNGTSWQNLSTVAASSPWLTSGNNIYNSNTNFVGIGTSNPIYKLDILHSSASGLRVKSDVSYSVVDIDAASGDAAIRFASNGVNKWLLRNQPGSDNFQIFDLSGGGSKFSIDKITGTIRMEGLLATGSGFDALSMGSFGSISIDAPFITGGRFRILETGNTGINDPNPAAKLTIGGNIKINDGTALAGKVLTAIDNSGLASWQNVAPNGWAINGSNISNSNSGNVGIGNSNPSFKLDLSGRGRIRGGINENFTAGLWLGGTGADSTVNKMFIGMESDSTAGFYSEQNGTGWFLVANGKSGRVGIRNRDPKFPLSFDNQGGDKISLFRDANGKYYGMGIGNATLQLMTPHNASNIVIGYGLSGSFTENMRIGGNGNVAIGTTDNSASGLTVNKKVGATHAIFGKNVTGVAIESEYPGIGFNSYYNSNRKTIATGYSGYIGVNPQLGGMQFLVSSQNNNTEASGAYNTAIDIKPDGKIGIGVSDPAYQLDLLGRMRIRSQPSGYTAGLWLNNVNNSASPAFLGMQTDDQVGFYGTGTGWSFLMNTQTGAISFGGNAGQPGQVLTSNGNTGAPSWQGGAGGGKHFVARPSANSPDLGTSGRIDVPNMVANFTLAVPSQVVFQYKLSIANRGCVACGDRRTFIVLIQNIVGGTTDIATTTVYTPNQEIADGVSGPIVLDLSAGTYSYKLAIAPSIYGAATVYARQQEGIMTWQIFPQ